MREIVVLTFMSLDGVMQAPGGPDEDTADGFTHGGWTVPFFDESLGAVMAQQMGEPFDLLLGRKTYDIFAGYWPHHDDQGASLNRARKYVVSRSPLNLAWENSVQIQGEVVQEIGNLKNEDGPMLQVHGSGNLIQTLLRHDLVDQLWLKIFPVTLGSGRRLFGEGTSPAGFALRDVEGTPSGVIVASFARAGEVKTGTF